MLQAATAEISDTNRQKAEQTAVGNPSEPIPIRAAAMAIREVAKRAAVIGASGRTLLLTSP
jgi:hypothetical protein